MRRLLNLNFFFVLIAILYFSSCREKVCQDKAGDDVKIDSLSDLYKDSILTNTNFVINAFYNLQPEIEDSVSIYRLQLILSELYSRIDIDSAFILNGRVLTFLNRQTESEQILLLKAKAKNARGVYYTQIDRRDSAIAYLKDTYDILNNIKEKELIPDVCSNLADCYQQNGEYSLSGFYYRRALFISDSLGLEDNYYSIYSGLGRLYNELDNFELADEFFVKAEKYLDKASDYEKYYFANSRGNYYYNAKEYENALKWFGIAYQLTNTFSQITPGAIVETNLGEIFILVNQYDSATLYLNRSKVSWGELYHQPSVKFYVDGLHASLALAENRLDDAEKILLRKYDMSAIVPQYIYYHNRRMQRFYELKNDYSEAYQYKTKADAYSDSLRSMKVQNNILEMAFRYQQDTTVLKKDLQIAEVEIKASQWRNIAIVSVFLFIVAILLAVGFYLYKKHLRELRHSRQLTIINNLRMEIIRNRITPHFTFNVLNVIIPSLDKYKELEQLFRLLIQMLRANLVASDKISVALDNEINLVKNYLQLYTISHPKHIMVNWEISEDVPMDIQIPSMSIQIPVENAVKYAFPETINDPQIDICISRKKDEIHIIIEDNGVGFYPSESRNNHQGTGNGLRMLYNTTVLLNSCNTRKMVFKIQNINKEQTKNNGTQVFVLVPFNYRYDV